MFVIVKICSLGWICCIGFPCFVDSVFKRLTLAFRGCIFEHTIVVARLLADAVDVAGCGGGGCGGHGDGAVAVKHQCVA